MDNIAEKTKEKWHRKRMHGQLPCNLDEKLVDSEESYHWLNSGNFKGETILIRKFLWKKLRVNAGYVNNMKKLLTT